MSQATLRIQKISGHAGTVPKLGRRDALAAASEMILAVEAWAKGEADLVATVGRLALTNPATNTIAGKARTQIVTTPSAPRRTL